MDNKDPQATATEQSLEPEMTSDALEPIELPPIDFVSPGRFEIHKSPAATPVKHSLSPAPYQLGTENKLQRFNTPETASAHLLALLQQAQRSVCILSDELEPWLYDQAPISQACRDFLLRSSKVQLRILLRDSSRIIQDGHQLIELARRLPSNCQIRKINPDRASPEEGFVIADDRGLLIYPDAFQPVGYSLYNDPGRSRQHQALFDHAWDYSLYDSNLRSMPL